MSAAQEASFSGLQSYCVSLNPYGVQVRYPNELAVDESIAQQAITFAEKIFTFCESIINPSPAIEKDSAAGTNQS